MDRARHIKLMTFILSGGLAFSGLNYAQNDSDSTAQNAGNNYQANTMPGTAISQRTTPAVPDEHLQSRVESALGQYSANIQVQVSNGVVTLTGHVPTEREKRHILQMVRASSMVRAVNDQIQAGDEPAAEGQEPTGVTLDEP